MKRTLSLTAIIGALLVVLIIAGATFWMSSGARSATEWAVEQISGFYLEELAGRRSQVISSFFDTKVAQMERAMELLDTENPDSQDDLRSFIGKIRTVLGLNLFAIVDEENIVYTEYTTYMGGSRYSFLSDPHENGHILTTIGTYGGGKEICLSVPVKDLTVMGKKIKICFIQIHMDDLVSMLAFNNQESGTHFNLYYKNGENLTGLDFGPITEKKNLLTEMKLHLTDSQEETLSKQFQNNIAGEIHFDFEDLEEILYYAPIPETDWVITVLIPKTLVYDHISGIQKETMIRSTLQILVTCLSLIIFFGILAFQARRQSKAMLEAEHKIAVRDVLTGVGNKYAFTQKETDVDTAIQNNTIAPFALVVCDLNGLKQVNDTQGHSAGDQLIRDACHIICELFDHSPVYRIGGDEFAVFLQGKDYDQKEILISELNRQVDQNTATGGVVIAAGLADFEGEDQQFHDVFTRADHRMYERKKQLKGL